MLGAAARERCAAVAGRTLPGRRPRHVQQTRGQLPLEGADRVTVLLDEQNLVAVPDLAQCHDRDRARVFHILARDLPGFTEVNDVAPDVPDHPLEHHRALPDRSLLQPVAQVSTMQDLGIQAHLAAWLISAPGSWPGRVGRTATLMA